MDDLPAGMTPYQHMVELMPDAPESQRRAKLGAFGFGHEKADTKAENLSGGEKARLLFALATFHAPHLLILDEPTNHLDVDSREALVRALNEYEGAVILISHDRHLVEASADRLWLVRDGTVRPYDGDMESYRAELLGDKSDPDAASTRSRILLDELAGLPEVKVSPQEARRLAAERRAQLAPLKKRVTDVELQMSRLTATIAKVDASLADTALYATDPTRAQKLTLERGQLAKTLADAEEIWLAASEAYEAAAVET